MTVETVHGSAVVVAEPPELETAELGPRAEDRELPCRSRSCRSGGGHVESKFAGTATSYK